MITSRTIIEFDALEDAPVTYIARIRNTIGTVLTQALTSSIACKVYRLSEDDDPELVSEPTVTVASTVFDTLQTDSIWDIDNTGYNFRHVLPGSIFSAPDTVYRVEYVVTPASGEVFPLKPLEVRTRQFYSS